MTTLDTDMKKSPDVDERPYVPKADRLRFGSKLYWKLITWLSITCLAVACADRNAEPGANNGTINGTPTTAVTTGGSEIFDTTPTAALATATFEATTVSATPPPEPPLEAIATAIPDGVVTDFGNRLGLSNDLAKTEVPWLINSGLVPAEENGVTDPRNLPTVASVDAIKSVFLDQESQVDYVYYEFQAADNLEFSSNYGPGDVIVHDDTENIVAFFVFTRYPIPAEAVLIMRDASGKLNNNLAEVKNGGTISWQLDGVILGTYELNPETGAFVLTLSGVVESSPETVETQSLLLGLTNPTTQIIPLITVRRDLPGNVPPVPLPIEIEIDPNNPEYDENGQSLIFLEFLQTNYGAEGMGFNVSASSYIDYNRLRRSGAEQASINQANDCNAELSSISLPEGSERASYVDICLTAVGYRKVELNGKTITWLLLSAWGRGPNGEPQNYLFESSYTTDTPYHLWEQGEMSDNTTRPPLNSLLESLFSENTTGSIIMTFNAMGGGGDGDNARTALISAVLPSTHANSGDYELAESSQAVDELLTNIELGATPVNGLGQIRLSLP